MPTGTIPSAIRVSWSVRPMQTTRSGAFSIVVSPYLCLIVTGKAPSSGPPEAAGLELPEPALAPGSLSLPQAARTGATARTERPARKRRREVFIVLLGEWVVPGVAVEEVRQGRRGAPRPRPPARASGR